MVLSPFEVSSESERGYTAATTLAGNRLNTELRDIGNAVSVVTTQFLKDVQATNNETLLQYTAGTEVGTVRGNFAGLGDGPALDEGARISRPDTSTRVRGLAEADNTRDYFLTDIPWDSYNVDRVDLQRGPNSILFGLGSPAGLLNTGTKQAGFKNSDEVQLRVDNYGSVRWQGNFNQVIIPRELAVRVDVLKEKQQYQQEPAFMDNDRIHGALRWEPAFLKKGSARTIFKASAENGNIKSNQPRSLPPLDRITPWFYTGTYNGTYKYAGSVPGAASGGVYTAPTDAVAAHHLGSDIRVYNNLNKETFNPFQLQDDNTGRANHGQERPVINGGSLSGYFNPAFNPWLGNFGDQFGGPNLFYANGAATLPANAFVWESRHQRGITSAGVIDGNIDRSFHRPAGIARYDQYATNAGLPYYLSGLYKGRSLTDSSVFDFYNNLIDGPNKKEWNDWNTYDLSLAQTFMNDKFGFQLDYHYEDYNRGQISLLSGDKQAIYVDVNNVYSDGTPQGLNGEPFQDGTPNPNVGRAFISDSGAGGNNSYNSKRDSFHATAFVTHDFAEKDNALWRRILGRHTITGLYADDTQKTDTRNWQQYAIIDPNYNTFAGLNTRFTDAGYRLNRVIYLGDSLSNRSSASGANLPRPTATVEIPETVTVRAFDSTWNGAAKGVQPSTPWNNVYYPDIPPFNDPTVNNPARLRWEAKNPNNYVGFRNVDVHVANSERSQAERDLLTTSAQLVKSEVTSKALVWQGYLLDKALVGTFGYRKDYAKAWGTSLASNQSADPHGYLDLSDSSYKLPEAVRNTVETQSRAYSIVAHLNELPFVSDWTKNLPVNVSLFYNKSSNFQPAAGRVDVYGEPLPVPEGKTIDRGILLETKDGKYSLKINKYFTAVKNASSSAITNTYMIGASQDRGANWANRFEYDIVATDNNNIVMRYQANNRPAGAPNPAGWTPSIQAGNADFDASNSLYNYGTDVGETAAQASAREKAAVDAWRAWQKSVDPRFYAAWGINLNDVTNKVVSSSAPLGFTVPEDNESSGYEIEFSANPTRNWRVTFNATKTEAIRTDVGGTNLGAFINAYQKALTTTAAGDLRIWWGGAGNETALKQWYQTGEAVGPDWNFKALQKGSPVPELRKWRFNAITNYDFTEGMLKGFNVGMGVRWQDKVGIGVRPFGVNAATPGKSDPYAGTFTLDPNDPYFYGPKETNYDAWIGYTRKLSRKFFNRSVEWNVQLNVTNLGKGNGLIPVTVQPDGSYGTYRIQPHEYWTLTSSIRF